MAQQVLLAPLSAPYPSPSAKHLHAIEIPHTSRLYKTLLQGGHYSLSTRSFTRSPSFEPGAFASAFVKAAGQENVVKMTVGGGAFVVAELCERLQEEGDAEVRREVKAWFGVKEVEAVKGSTVKGRDVLLEKLRALAAS